MPNIKSSIRSVKTDAERRAKNGPVKAALRGASRKVVALAEAGSQEAAAKLVVASSLIDSAARKGVIHKNAAARKKSRLAKKVNAMA